MSDLDSIDLSGEDNSDVLNEEFDENSQIDLDTGEEPEDPDQSDIDTESSQEADKVGQEDITNITQLAEEFGVEPSAIYDLEVPMGDGVDSVSLSAMKDFYQQGIRGKDNLAEEREALNQERAVFQRELSLRSENEQQLDKRIVDAEAELQQINSTYNSLDWELFERENPGEAALQKQKFQEAFNAALSKKEQALKTVDIERSSARDAYMTNQSNQVKEMIPEWSDQKTYQDDRISIRNLLGEYNFSEQDIQAISDAKTIKLLYDFSKLKNRISNAKPKQKKEISSILRTGSLRRAAKSKNTDVNKIISNAARSKDKNVKAAAVTKLLDNI